MKQELMSTQNIILNQLQNRYNDAFSAKSDAFIPALRRLINALNNTFFYRTMTATLLHENETKWDKKPSEVAELILEGDTQIFYDSYYQEIVSFFIINSINDKGEVPSHLRLAVQKEHLKPFWERIERTVVESNNILYLLLKFKKRCELYDRDFILEDLDKFRRAKKEKAIKKGKNVNIRVEEGFFAPKINCYLFDNCIEIVSEPKVKEKRVDVLGIVKGPRAEISDFILEYKVLLKSKRNHKKYLIEAFYQAYSYGKNYQKNTVYLIIFTIGEGDVTLNLDLITIDDTSISYYEFDGIRILAIKINLSDEKAAGEINKNDLDQFFSD